MARETHTVLSVTFCPITSQTHRVDPVRFQRHIAVRWWQCFGSESDSMPCRREGVVPYDLLFVVKGMSCRIKQ